MLCYHCNSPSSVLLYLTLCSALEEELRECTVERDKNKMTNHHFEQVLHIYGVIYQLLFFVREITVVFCALCWCFYFKIEILLHQIISNCLQELRRVQSVIDCMVELNPHQIKHIQKTQPDFRCVFNCFNCLRVFIVIAIHTLSSVSLNTQTETLSRQF